MNPDARARPIRLVIGFSPGSASDQIAALIAAPFAARLGRTVTLVRSPGNNGVDAARAVAAADADGNTLFVATLGTHALAPCLRTPSPYDACRDFAPVALLVRAPLLLACHPAVPVRSPGELVVLARGAVGTLTYATSAVGGAPHLAAELFQHLAGITLRHVRFDDTNVLYRDLEAGRVSLSFNNIMSMLPRVRAGALRALAVSTADRSSVAPDVPAIADSGLPGYDVSNWLGVVAPKGVASGTIAALSAALSGALQDAEVRAALAAAGVTPDAGTPEVFAEFMAAELQRWRPVVARFRDTAA